MTGEHIGQRWRMVLESTLFDAAYLSEKKYLTKEPGWQDVVRFCCNPDMFSISPSKKFDAQAYLDAYPDCITFELHPIVHYLEFGRAEGRQVFPVLTEADYAALPKGIIFAESHSLDYTGAPMEMERLLSALNLNPRQILVTSPVSGPLQAVWAKKGFETLLHGLSERRVKNKLDLDALVQNGVQILETLHPMGVFVNSLMGFPMACAAHKIGLPYIWVVHEPSADDLLQRFPADVHTAVFNVMRHAKSIVFVSKSSQQAFAPYLHGSVNQHVIPKVLPPTSMPTIQDRDKIRHDLGLGSDDMMLLSVGTFSPRKDQATLVNALRQISGDKRRLKCIMVGATDTEYSKDIITKVQDIKASICAVKILPQTATPGQRRTVERMFAAADVVVVTSNAESSPLTVSESFAAGCPVLCSDLPGVSDEMRENVNGLLFPVGDFDALAQRIMELRDNIPVRERLRQGARQSAHYVSDHGQMCAQYKELIAQVWSGVVKTGP